MALNFLHADCSFVSPSSLAVQPNRAQLVVFANLRGILKAFGNCAGDINVPASGRRSTALVSMLADLSDFFVSHGLSGSAYEAGFDAALQSKDGVVADLSRAEELTPYRSLDPSRLKLSGTAQWSPLSYLDDDLWLPYVEPDVLLWGGSYDYNDLPNLDKEDPGKVLELARLWDVNGLLMLSPKPIDYSMKSSHLRVFNCYKSAVQDRQIGDRRGRNQLEGYLPGVSRSLPTGPNLTALEINPARQRLAICLSDRKDFYHQFKVSASRAEANALWPPLKLEDLAGTKAYDRLLEQQAANKKKKPREAVGDFLGGLPEKSFGSRLPEYVFACFSSVAQGDHLGVEIATQSHWNMLKSRGLLVEEEELTSNFPFGGSRCLQGLIIDDFWGCGKPSICSTVWEEAATGTTCLWRRRFDWIKGEGRGIPRGGQSGRCRAGWVSVHSQPWTLYGCSSSFKAAWTFLFVVAARIYQGYHRLPPCMPPWRLDFMPHVPPSADGYPWQGAFLHRPLISQSGESSDSPSSSPCRSGVRFAGRPGPLDVFRYLSKDLAFPFRIRCIGLERCCGEGWGWRGRRSWTLEDG